MFKAIHIKKCCVEVSYILSNGAGEELTTMWDTKKNGEEYMTLIPMRSLEHQL